MKAKNWDNYVMHLFGIHFYPMRKKIDMDWNCDKKRQEMHSFLYKKMLHESKEKIIDVHLKHYFLSNVHT